MTRMLETVEMDVVAGPGAEGARRATGGPGPVTTSRPPDPDPEVSATVQRRRCSAEYRLRILKAADACKRPGEVGALLRREGLYSSLLTSWRWQRDTGALREMRGRRRGPTPRPVDPRMKQLEAENRRLRRKLQRAETIITLKKSCRDPGDSPDAPRRRRDRLMRAIEAVTTPGETAALYRRRRPAPPATPTRPRAPSPRALGATERQAVLDVLPSEWFVDLSPAAVHATLLEEQTCLCAPRTMYRVLAAAREVRERRAQARHPAYTKPELVATGPNQVWSWDITKLKGPIPYFYFSLYVILDLFSRYAVGWMVARHEHAHLAERLIAATCRKQGIAPHQLTIHADRGAPMRSKLVALLFSDLGIDASHSRPRVSNDNPFSEAQFRTLKYRPAFPDRFGSRAHARAVSRDLFAWYNDVRRAPSQRPQLSHAGRRPLRPRRDGPRGPPPHAAGRVCGPSRAVRAGGTTARNAPNSRLDQSAADPDPRGCPRSDDRHPGRPAAWGDPPGTTHPSRTVERPRRQREGATVNAESGCLKSVDTARVVIRRQLADDSRLALREELPRRECGKRPFCFDWFVEPTRKAANRPRSWA